jgi:hypothetical protein
LRYNDDGHFAGLEINGQLTPAQSYWLLRHTAVKVDDLQRALCDSKTAKLTPMPENVPEVDFEMFWARYDDKVNSSKKRARAKWDKMSKENQQKAYLYLPKYFAHLPQNTRKKYVETYLSAELWNN